MPKVRLNDKSVRRPAPAHGQLELWDDTVPGFGLRISAGGARTYIAMRRIGGKLVRRTIGKAPDLAILPGTALAQGFFWPADARKEARRVLADMEAGKDPGLRRLRKDGLGDADAAAQGTFKAIADKYLASSLKGGGGRLRSKAELERKLKVDLVSWHQRPIAEIRKRDIQALIDAKAEVSPVAANRLLSFVKRVFAWADEKDYLEADPARSVRKPADETPRDRFLDEREIALFWRACDKLDEPEDGDPRARGPLGRLLQLALVTGQRRGEVAGLCRSELGKIEYEQRDPATGKQISVKYDAWVLPPERTKRGNLASPDKRARMEPHVVPLSTLGLSLIEGAPQRAGPDGAMFDHVFATGAAGDQPPSAWNRAKRRLDELIGREIAKEAGEDYDPERHHIPEWHIHDLRATAATLMSARLGVPKPILARILNHSEGDEGRDRGRSMTVRYIRHTWDAEAAVALNRWADLLGQLCGLNVVSMKGAGARNSNAARKG